jgi:hypothetical protein
MSYSLFNRHTNMSFDTLKSIGSFITHVQINHNWENAFTLLNMLYGLYDGYFYDELVPTAKTILNQEEFNQLEGIIQPIYNYPKING